MLQDRRSRELALLVGLIAAGFLVLPVVVWLVGWMLLGPQAGGPGSVYASVFSEAARGKLAAWFFAASPYLVVQSARLTLWSLRSR